MGNCCSSDGDKKGSETGADPAPRKVAEIPVPLYNLQTAAYIRPGMGWDGATDSAHAPTSGSNHGSRHGSQGSSNHGSDRGSTTSPRTASPPAPIPRAPSPEPDPNRRMYPGLETGGFNGLLEFRDRMYGADDNAYNWRLEERDRLRQQGSTDPADVMSHQPRWLNTSK